MTNFWEHLFKGMTPMEAGVAEAAQALTVVRIANKLPSLKHFIWSTLPGNVEGVSTQPLHIILLPTWSRSQGAQSSTTLMAKRMSIT